MARNNELIRLAKKAAGTWRNTHEYQQAAQIIDMLVDELEKSTLTQPNEPLTVTEVCPHCESEITMEWNVKTLGYKAYCPVCGHRLMLCDECQHGEPGHICDYDSNKDTCRFNRCPPEGQT